MVELNSKEILGVPHGLTALFLIHTAMYSVAMYSVVSHLFVFCLGFLGGTENPPPQLKKSDIGQHLLTDRTASNKKLMRRKGSRP